MKKRKSRLKISRKKISFTPIVILITTQSLDQAKKISRTLVEQNLAACVNIVPGINSIYRWEGKVCEDNETLLICKTEKSLTKKFISSVKKMHAYEVPEIITLPIQDGNPDYLAWLQKSVSTKK